MSALLVSYNISNFFMESLHNLESLGVAAYTEQFLHHVVGIFMCD